MKIGYQGIEGSNSEEVAHLYGKELRNEIVEYIPLIDSIHVVNSLINKEIDIGVMATYNYIAGIVEETETALKNTNLNEIKEIEVPIHHCLFKKKEVNLNDIKIIASHIQALSQTRNNVRRLLSNTIEQEVEDTGLAAKKLANGELEKDTAVICRKNAGQMYNLDLVFENIEDDKNNFTRFGIYKLKE